MKTLISANTIRECKERGQTSIAAPLSSTIVTPEARDMAAKLGISLTQDETSSAGGQTCALNKLEQSISNQLPGGGGDAGAVQKIQQAVSERLPAGSVDPRLLEQLVRKAMQELEAGAPAGSCQRQLADNGVVLVRGNSVQMGRFDGAPGKNIGLTDVINSADQARMSAGYMSWENAFFPWTLKYDEIDIVLEGELHIRADGKTYVGKPGDVFFIPDGASIEFGTPGSVRFVYVTYPADWAG